MAINEDWSPTLGQSIASVGAFALVAGSRDAALMLDLSGAYSLQVRVTGAGTVLVEAYDAGTGRVGTGDDILIAGFAIAGTGSKQLLIRAVGPGLGAFNVAGALTDPRLDVFNDRGVNVAANDNWSAKLAPSFSSVGAFSLPSGRRVAALLTSLPVGSYTVQVRGADSVPGEAIVEIYEVP